MANIDSVIEKLKKVVGCRTDTDLARALGTASSTVSTWKARQAIPYDLIARVAEERHIPFTWFFTEDSSSGDPTDTGVAGAPIPLLRRIPEKLPADVLPEHVAAHISLPGIPANAFAVIAGDDSLAPRVKEGDYVIFEPDMPVQGGDIVVASNEWDDILVRRYREKDGQGILAADQPEYPFVSVDEGGGRIHGKVVDVWRQVKV